MKKVVLLILAAVALCSCSKNETDTAVPVSGQYIYESENLTAAVRVDNTETGITIYENGSYVYQSLHRSVYGSWPTYRYEYGYNYSELVLDCQYAENTAFVATVSDNQTEVSLPATMQFKLDNRTLDANGDGILDEMQPDLFQ